MAKIQMKTPLVEMDGDEMTRILWKIIKDELIYPFIDLKSEYYDLGLEYRNETNDKVTFDSAYATQKYGVALEFAEELQMLADILQEPTVGTGQQMYVQTPEQPPMQPTYVQTR